MVAASMSMVVAVTNDSLRNDDEAAGDFCRPFFCA